jgi:parallel beta-helix repeat protein
MILNGNLIVKKGSALTLNKVKLTINVSHDGEYGISVEPGGELTIDGSTITSPNPEARMAVVQSMIGNFVAMLWQSTNITEEQSPRFSFIVKGIKFDMKNSTILGCGWSSPDSSNEGLFLGDIPNVTIDNNTFSNSCFGIIQNHKSTSPLSTSITNNKFLALDYNGIYLRNASSDIITGNTFSSSDIGVLIEYSKGNTISNNTFTNLYDAGIWLFSSCENNNLLNNTITDPVGITGWSGISIGATPGAEANNNTIKGNIITGGGDGAGINIYNSDSNLIQDNTITDSQNGIYLGHANGNEIINNVVKANGILNIPTGDNTGLELFHSSNNVVANNSISFPQSYGLLLSGSSQNNTIQCNSIDVCVQGVGVYNLSNSNSLINNLVKANQKSGIIINNATGNILYTNDFIGNSALSYDNGGNTWNMNGKGNYWSDYQGVDSNHDGIGDTPRVISPAGKDNYPIIQEIPLSQFTPPEMGNTPIFQVTHPGPLTITNAVTWENSSLVLDQETSIEINDGGTLTISNMTIIIPEGFDHIDIKSGGSLIITNSKIITTDSGGGYTFSAENGSSLEVKGSEIHGAGFSKGGDWGGIDLFTTNVTIEDSLITDSYVGIDFSQLHLQSAESIENTSIFIRNNTITNCVVPFGGMTDVPGHIENNTFLNGILPNYN